MPCRNHRLRALAPLAIAALALSSCGDDDVEEPRRGQSGPIEIVIGNSVPLSGELRRFGPDAKTAGRLAKEQIEKAIKKAGVDDRVELITVDNGSKPAKAAQTAQELIDDGADCIVGPWGGPDTLTVAREVAVPQHITLISPAATLDELTDLTDSGLINRTAAPDSAQGKALASAIADDLGGADGRTVNVGARDDAYGETLASAFISAWKKEGGKVGSWVTYDVDREAPGAIAKDLAKGKPDATAIFDFPSSFAKLAPALISTRGYDPARTWAADLLASTDLPGEVPDAAIEGLRGTLPSAPLSSPATTAFLDLFASRGSDSPRPFAAQTFDAVILCYLAAVASGSSDPAGIGPAVPAVSSPEGKKFTWEQLPKAIKVLGKGKEIDYQGASGPLDIDVHGDPTAATYDIYQFSGDAILLVDQVSIGGGGSRGAE